MYTTSAVCESPLRYFLFALGFQVHHGVFYSDFRISVSDLVHSLYNFEHISRIIRYTLLHAHITITYNYIHAMSNILFLFSIIFYKLAAIGLILQTVSPSQIHQGRTQLEHTA